MYPLMLLKTAEQYSWKSIAEEHDIRNREEGIVIVRIKSTIIIT
jgi:hypothetical protein